MNLAEVRRGHPKAPHATGGWLPLTVRLRVAGSRMTLLAATAHLESGLEGEPLRRQQLAEVRTALGDDAVDAALFAAVATLVERRLSEPITHDLANANEVKNG